MESLSDLRAKVQQPVRRYNDVAGLLVGDHLSIHVTRLFVVWGISPTVATLAMLVCGLAGSVLILFDGVWAVAGFALVLGYYVLDCVDGEVARYHRIEKLIWGYHDFLFHLYVKVAFFTSLGIYAARCTGQTWMFFLPYAALIGVLFQKFQNELTNLLVCRYVLLRGRAESEQFVEQLAGEVAEEEPAADGWLESEQQPTRFGGFLPLMRAALTNFDLAVLLFLVAALADLFLDPFAIWTLQGNCRIALVLFYGFILPLDFADRLWSYLRDHGFERDARRLLRRAHHFRVRR